jgi:hypothetical protein
MSEMATAALLAGETATTLTAGQYAALDHGFRVLNERLFDGELPLPLFTLQRKSRMAGYYHFEKFRARMPDAKGRRSAVDEIAINPEHFSSSTDEEILSTLLHEMVHLWQCHFGKRPRTCYHDRQWADKMESVGLMPSTTGRPGGKRTGQRVGDYIIPGGVFEALASELISQGWTMPWEDRHAGDVVDDPKGRGEIPVMVQVVAALVKPDTAADAGEGEASGDVGTSGAGADSQTAANFEERYILGHPKQPPHARAGEPWTREEFHELPERLRVAATQALALAKDQTVEASYLGRPLAIARAHVEQLDVKPGPTKRSGVRVKYVCPVCHAAVWGKSGLEMLCVKDSMLFVSERDAIELPQVAHEVMTPTELDGGMVAVPEIVAGPEMEATLTRVGGVQIRHLGQAGGR